MENLKKVELIAQHLEARASGWTAASRTWMLCWQLSRQSN